ncbi:MAG: Hpt domain-containing protein [bacterium]|nr:Hpt domain-containing protein [bacterium]
MSPGAETGVFDRTALFNRLGEDDGFVREVIEGFLEDIPTRFAVLEEAFEQGDAVLVRRHAHTIKGAAANISAYALREAAGAVESAVESGDLAKAVSLKPQLDRQFEILTSELKHAV